MVRGMCMAAILWFHSEAYYADDLLTPYSMYVNTVLGCFFFISGYLLYPVRWHARQKYRSVLRWLLLPYVLFTLAMMVVKVLAHYQDATWQTELTDILTGRASWFVAALIVAQCVMVGVLSLSKGSTGAVALLFVSSIIMTGVAGNEFSPWYIEANPWSVHEALVGIACMCLGYAYHVKEERLWQHRRVVMAASAAVLVAVKYLVYIGDLWMTFAPVRVSNLLLFFADILSGSVLICMVMRMLPRIGILEWTGRHCIVYYFICGAVPMSVSWAVYRMGMSAENYPNVAVVFVLSWIASTIVAWAVYRYTRIVR